MKNILKLLSFAIILMTFSNCQDNSAPVKQENKIPQETKIFVPEFNADSAYAFIKAQVDFGPRVPNTKNHSDCAKYLEEKMKMFNAEVIVQKAKVTAYDGSTLNISNIISSYQPEKQRRILFFAHWDSRPWADHCKDSTLQNNPILGANDGASGVGVLLEMGRLLAQYKPDVGVDIIFFDAEDYGTPDHLDLPYKEDTWCLGSQYWSVNMHVMGYYPMYGILLDMVGAEKATFYKEVVSDYFAPDVVRKVWNIASKIGYSQYFIDQKGGQVTDDHLYVNRIAKIPSIDIIHHDPNTESRFGEFWHTHDDNMDVINKETLKAVGQTLMSVIFYEK